MERRRVGGGDEEERGVAERELQKGERRRVGEEGGAIVMVVY